MGYIVAGLVIALGVTMVVAGVSGSGSELFQGLTGRSTSGKSQSAKSYGNTASGNATAQGAVLL